MRANWWWQTAASGMVLAVATALLAGTPASAERPDPHGGADAQFCDKVLARIQSKYTIALSFAKTQDWDYFTAWLVEFGQAVEDWASNEVGPGWTSCQERYGAPELQRVADDTSGGEWDTRPSSWAGYVYHAKQLVGGDLNGDGRQDLLALGSHQNGLAALPVAFSKGDGTYTVTSNPGIGSITPGDTYYSPWAQFMWWSTDPWVNFGGKPKVKHAVGDFNNDGRDDVALLGGTGWNTVPVAFSQGLHPDGFLQTTITNFQVPQYFSDWAGDPRVTVITGNFDGFGGDDIALLGVPTWTSIPVALSNGNGTFTVSTQIPKPGANTNCAAPDPATVHCSQFLWWASDPQAVVPDRPRIKPLLADFNGDGRDDIALAGGQTQWRTVPVAYSNSGSSTQIVPFGFTVINHANEWFSERARDWAAPWGKPSTVQIMVGDYTRDGRPDLATFGTHDSFTHPDPGVGLAVSSITGPFYAKRHQFLNTYQGTSMLNVANALTFIAGNKIVTGDFNNDGLDDVAVTGAMNFVCTLFANPDGSYTYNDKYVV